MGRSSRLLQPLDAASRMLRPTFPCVGFVITPEFLLKSYTLVPRTVTLYGKRVFADVRSEEDVMGGGALHPVGRGS